MQDKRLTICRNVFFQADSAVQECCENLKKHKEDILIIFGHKCRIMIKPLFWKIMCLI